MNRRMPSDPAALLALARDDDRVALARLVSLVERGGAPGLAVARLAYRAPVPYTIGLTGAPGAGKSTLTDRLITLVRSGWPDPAPEPIGQVGVLAVDPTSPFSGGAILGDRVRMQQHALDPTVFIRSMATRGHLGGLALAVPDAVRVLGAVGLPVVIVETVGVGQMEIEVASAADTTMVVVTPGWGDSMQANKAGLLEIADIFVINKADRPGAEQTQRELESMLSLGHAALGNASPDYATTVPAIYRTVAIDGTGMPELLDDLETRHRKLHERAKSQHWEIDHLGIAVRSLDDSLPFYTTHLGLPVLSRETVEHEKVNVAMLPAGTSRIELLEPLDPTSTIAKFLEKRGPGLHHIAMRVPDLNATVRRLESGGIRLLGAPQRGAGGHLYVFVHPASTGGVLWELIQDRERH